MHARVSCPRASPSRPRSAPWRMSRAGRTGLAACRRPAPSRARSRSSRPRPAVCPRPRTRPQRTIWWQAAGRDRVLRHRYVHRAVYGTYDLTFPRPGAATFDVEQQSPHIVFTPTSRPWPRASPRGVAGRWKRPGPFYDYVTRVWIIASSPPICSWRASLISAPGSCGGPRRVPDPVHHPVPHLRHPCSLAERTLRPATDGAATTWAMFYIAPHGWLWADCSFSSAARRHRAAGRRAHYFGNLDPWRMVANSALYAPLTPPMTGWRQDPYDNQRGRSWSMGRAWTIPSGRARCALSPTGNCRKKSSRLCSFFPQITGYRCGGSWAAARCQLRQLDREHAVFKVGGDILLAHALDVEGARWNRPGGARSRDRFSSSRRVLGVHVRGDGQHVWSMVRSM